MGPMASQITSRAIVTQPFIQVQIKETSKLRVTGICVVNSPLAGELPAQMASNTEMFPFYEVIMIANHATSVTVNLWVDPCNSWNIPLIIMSLNDWWSKKKYWETMPWN